MADKICLSPLAGSFEGGEKGCDCIVRGTSRAVSRPSATAAAAAATALCRRC